MVEKRQSDRIIIILALSKQSTRQNEPKRNSPKATATAVQRQKVRDERN